MEEKESTQEDSVATKDIDNSDYTDGVLYSWVSVEYTQGDILDIRRGHPPHAKIAGTDTITTDDVHGTRTYDFSPYNGTTQQIIFEISKIQFESTEATGVRDPAVKGSCTGMPHDLHYWDVLYYWKYNRAPTSIPDSELNERGLVRGFTGQGVIAGTPEPNKFEIDTPQEVNQVPLGSNYYRSDVAFRVSPRINANTTGSSNTTKISLGKLRFGIDGQGNPNYGDNSPCPFQPVNKFYSANHWAYHQIKMKFKYRVILRTFP